MFSVCWLTVRMIWRDGLRRKDTSNGRRQGLKTLSRFVTLCIMISNLQGFTAVKIVNMVVPEIIQLGIQDSVVLDCDYIYGNNTSGLVVKWFFKKTKPVYQWIPTKKPQDLGLLKGKVDLTYRASEDPFKIHRAVRITKPGTDVSGDYTCVVSTFMEEDQRTRRMTVFVPESTFSLVHNKSDDDSVNVICSAGGMYPAPNLTISAPQSKKLQSATHSVQMINGKYYVTTMVTLLDEDLPTPTEFICTLKIPQANYVVRKETLYYPGPIITTPEMPTAADMQLAASSTRIKDALTIVTCLLNLALKVAIH